MNTKNKEEILARKCLELLVNRNFLKLLISDRPDLQSQELNVGIEVTTSRNTNDRKKINFLNKYLHGKNLNANQKKAIIDRHAKELKGLEKDITVEKNGLSYCKLESEHYENILNCIKNKKMKAKDYVKFESNQLFIITQTISLDSLMLLGIFDKIKNSKFDIIYIYCLDVLYILDCIHNKIDEREIDGDINKVLKESYDNA